MNRHKKQKKIRKAWVKTTVAGQIIEHRESNVAPEPANRWRVAVQYTGWCLGPGQAVVRPLRPAPPASCTAIAVGQTAARRGGTPTLGWKRTFAKIEVSQ